MVMLPVSADTPADPYTETKQFLAALDPAADNFLFVLIHPDKDKPKAARHVNADTVYESLRRWNDEGYNVYICINETNHGKGYTRTKDEVTWLRCIYIDDDGKMKVGDYPLPPSMVVESSPGKRQLYWLLEDAPGVVNIDEWDQVQQTLVNEWGGDASARDAARVLRLPGYRNVKATYPNKPLCHFIEPPAAPAKRYAWAEILAAFPPSEVVTSTGRKQGESLDLKATIEQFISGENYHEAGIALAGYYYNKGVTQSEELIEMLQGFMDMRAQPGDARFDQRRNKDIPGSVGWIIKKRAEEGAKHEANAKVSAGFVKQGVELQYTKLPMPGGGLYKIIQWIRSTMRYPNDTIAITAAEHLVSVFGGGHYCLQQNTCTRKRIVLAPQGSGKNTLTRGVSKAVGELLAVNKTAPYVTNATKFIGSDGFSFSVQHAQIQDHRVRSFLVNEAGEGGKSKAGDISSLRQYQLQALSTKADDTLYPKEYSQASGEAPVMQPVTNAVWVYLHESTIKSYPRLLQDTESLANGDLSRSDLIFVDPRIREKNKVIKHPMPDEVRRLFAALANDTLACGDPKGTKYQSVFEEIDCTAIEAGLDKLEDEIIEARNKALDQQEDVRSSQLARRFERVMTAVLVCALADSVDEKGFMHKPVARQKHLDYAIKRVDAIDATVHFHACGGGALSEHQFEQVERQFVQKMRELMKDPAKARGNSYVMMQGKHPALNACWLMKKQTFNQILKRGAMSELIRTTYRGDKDRADRAVIEHLIGCEFIESVFEKNSLDEFKPVKNRWWVKC